MVLVIGKNYKLKNLNAAKILQFAIYSYVSAPVFLLLLQK